MIKLIESHYAVNIVDLASILGLEGKFHPLRLLLQKHLSTEIVACEGKRFDGDSVRVSRSVKQEQWDAIMTIIREGVPGGKIEPIPKYKLRIYESKTGHGSWRRI